MNCDYCGDTKWFGGDECPQCSNREHEPARPAGDDSLHRVDGQTDDKCGAEIRAAMRAAEVEQREEWEDYLRRCGGTPISSVRPW